MIRLMFVRRGASGQPAEVRAFDRAVVWVGREVAATDPTREAAWVLQYPDVSRQQCRFERVGEAVSVEPLSARSATFVNGVRIEVTTRLKPGDVVRFGDCKLSLLGEVGAAASAEPPRDQVGRAGEIRDAVPQQRPGRVERAPAGTIKAPAVEDARPASRPSPAAAPQADHEVAVPEDMSPIVARARRWEELGRPAGELLRDPGLLRRGQVWLRGGATLGADAALARKYIEASAQARRAGWRRGAMAAAGLVGALVTGSVTARVFADELSLPPLDPATEGEGGVCKDEDLARAERLVQAAEQVPRTAGAEGALLTMALAAAEAQDSGCMAQSRAEEALRRELAGQRSQRLGQHDEAVAAVAAEASGRFAATIGASGRIWVWDLEAGRGPYDLGVRASVAEWSRDQKWLIVGGPDGRVTLFDAQKWPPESRHELRQHSAKITVLASSPDGSVLVTGDERGALKVWPLFAPVIDEPFASREVAALRSVAFDGSGRRLFTLADGRVRVWPLTAKRLGEPRELATAGVSTMAVNLAGDRVLTGDRDGIVTLWKTVGTAWKSVEAHPPFADAVVAVEFVPGQNAALVATRDRKLVYLRLDRPRLGKGQFHAHYFEPLVEPPRSMVVEGQRAVTVGEKESPQVWDLVKLSTQPRPSLTGHVGVTALQAVDARSVVISGDKEGVVRLWSLLGESKEGAYTLSLQGRGVVDLTLSSDGQFLVAAGEGGAVHLWNLEDGGRGRDPRELPPGGPVTRIAVGRDGKWVAGVGDGAVVVWDGDGKSKPSTLSHPSVRWVGWSPDGSALVSAGRDGVVKIWRVRGGDIAGKPEDYRVGEVERLAVSNESVAVSVKVGDKQQQLLLLPLREEGTRALPPALKTETTDGTGALVFDARGRRLAAGYSSGTTRMWLLDGEQVRQTAAHDSGSAVMALSFASTGELAVGNLNGEVFVLQPDEPGGDPDLRGRHTQAVTGVAFGSSSDVLVAVASAPEATLRRGGRTIELVGHREAVSKLVGAPTGRFVATAGDDDMIRVWPLEAEGLLQLTCKTVGRELRPEEWATHLPWMTPRPLCPSHAGE